MTVSLEVSINTPYRYFVAEQKAKRDQNNVQVLLILKRGLVQDTKYRQDQSLYWTGP